MVYVSGETTAMHTDFLIWIKEFLPLDHKFIFKLFLIFNLAFILRFEK